MDGSALRFVQAILRAGLAPVPGPLRAIRVLKPVRDVAGRRGRRARAGRGAVDRLRDRLPRRGDRPPGPAAVDGERRLRARARRLPHLLPPRRRSRRCRRTAWRSAARSTTRWWSTAPGAQPGRPAPGRRVRAPQDARRARRPGAGGRADPRRLPRRAGRARRDQPAAAPAVRDAGRLRMGHARCRGGGVNCPARASARRTCAAPVEAGHAATERSPRGLRFSFQPPGKLC